MWNKIEQKKKSKTFFHRIFHRINSYMQDEINKDKRHKNMWHIIVCVALIMFWRWISGILNELIFPNHPIISYLIAIIIALTLLLLDDSKLNEL